MKLLLLFVILLGATFLTQSVKALELTCTNFTGEKLQDCNYLTSSGLSYDDEQETLNILWDQSYTYEGYLWNPEPSNLIASPPINSTPIVENKNLILASKILFFGLFNYLVFSLTKSSFILKWLAVG